MSCLLGEERKFTTLTLLPLQLSFLIYMYYITVFIVSISMTSPLLLLNYLRFTFSFVIIIYPLVIYIFTSSYEYYHFMYVTSPLSTADACTSPSLLISDTCVAVHSGKLDWRELKMRSTRLGKIEKWLTT